MLQFAAFPIPPNAGVVSKQMVNGMSDGKLARGATLFLDGAHHCPWGIHGSLISRLPLIFSSSSSD